MGYSKQHFFTDLYKLKQDIRFVYGNGSQYMVPSSISALKHMVFQIEEIEKVARYVRDPDSSDGKSDNGIDSDRVSE